MELSFKGGTLLQSYLVAIRTRHTEMLAAIGSLIYHTWQNLPCQIEYNNDAQK